GKSKRLLRYQRPKWLRHHLQNYPRRHIHHTSHLLLERRLHRRHIPLGGISSGQRWELLRGSCRRRGLWSRDDLQNYPRWYAHYLAPVHLGGRLQPPTANDPGHGWEPLRRDQRWRIPQLGNALQDEPQRHADHTL